MIAEFLLQKKPFDPWGQVLFPVLGAFGVSEDRHGVSGWCSQVEVVHSGVNGNHSKMGIPLLTFVPVLERYL